MHILCIPFKNWLLVKLSSQFPTLLKKTFHNGLELGSIICLHVLLQIYENGLQIAPGQDILFS